MIAFVPRGLSMTEHDDLAKNQKTSLYVTAAQKQRLQAMAQRAGFSVGRGSDSQLPAFLDQLMAVYPLELPGEDGLEVWGAFLERLGPLVAQLQTRMKEWDVEISELLSPYGGAYVEIKDKSKQIPPGAYARHEFGPAEFEAVGRLIVQLVERLDGFRYQFESLAAANAFWVALVQSVQTIDGQIHMRQAAGPDGFALPG